MIIISDACTINITMSVNDASRIITDDSGVTLQIVASLTDYSWGIVYYPGMFRVQEGSKP
jgi:hypothetical protein